MSSSFGRSILLAALALAAGCATSNPRARYLQQLEPASLTNLVAYRTDTNIELRIPFPGKDAFAHASWPRVEGAAPDYQRQFAVLTFDKEERAARKTTVTKTNLLPLRTPQEWRQLVQKIFAGLAPTQPGHGVLLLAQNQEIIVLRDAAGKLGVVKLENKPPEIVVDHTYEDSDFSREALGLLETG
ncbi:MAG: hypothetical protein ABSA47_12290, partial [Verrucomicrobiota bacterium]